MNRVIAASYNAAEMDAGRFTPDHVAELVAFWQREHGLIDDGKAGPSTRSSIEAAQEPQHSTAIRTVPAGHVWTPFDGPLETQPRSRSDVFRLFGDPGTKVAPSKTWQRDNIREFHGANAMPGVPEKWYFQIHKLIVPYAYEAFRRARIAAPDYVIERAGGFVLRHIRHNAKNPLSMHAFGIAIDIDPDRNFSRTFAKGTGPAVWSEEYMKIWPNGVPRAFVEAFVSCGFAWGSDWDEDGISSDQTYYDPMHFEWVARNGAAHLV